MVYQALCDFSSSHTFQMGQLMGKVVIQGKIFPNKLFQMPTITKDKVTNICVVVKKLLLHQLALAAAHHKAAVWNRVELVIRVIKWKVEIYKKRLKGN